MTYDALTFNRLREQHTGAISNHVTELAPRSILETFHGIDKESFRMPY